MRPDPSILIVDDHEVVRRGLADLLAERFPTAFINHASDCVSAMKQLPLREWQLVILDLSLPGRGGLELIKEIRQAKPNLPVLVFTMHPEHECATRAFRAGARGYLTKMSPNALLLEAVDSLLGGGRFVTPTMADRLVDALISGGESQLPHETLTDREFEVFLGLAAGETVGTIAHDLNLSVQTVSTYRARVLDKMALKSNAELIRYAMGASIPT